MQWHVHGTDVATGQRMTLAIEEREATHAVQAALSKRIIVSHVTRATLRRAFFPLACAAAVVFLSLCAWLYLQNSAAEARLQAALADQSRLANSLTQADELLKTLQSRIAAAQHQSQIAPAPDAQMQRRLAELQNQVAAAATLQTCFASAQQELQSARDQAEQLHAALQQRTSDALAAQQLSTTLGSRAAALEQQDAAFRSQIDLLKSQLLLAAAKSTITSDPHDADKTEPSSAAPRPSRWSLRAGYDAASDFVAMHFDKETMHTEPVGEGAFAWTAASAANAATVRVLHDHDRQRVFAATLTVSLAPDAPRQKLDENLRLVRTFLAALSPGLANADARIPRAVQQLADKDVNERIVLIARDSKITVWNNHLGVYSWRIESIGNDLAE